MAAVLLSLAACANPVRSEGPLEGGPAPRASSTTASLTTLSRANGLTLELEVPAVLRRLEPVPVRVVLRNAGEAPMTVNARMGPGYGESISREVFFEFQDASGGAVSVQPRKKYERDLPSPSDYRSLAPRETIEVDIDLLDWLRPPPGRYRVTARYQADEPLAKSPPDVVRGVIQSAAQDVLIE